MFDPGIANIHVEWVATDAIKLILWNYQIIIPTPTISYDCNEEYAYFNKIIKTNKTEIQSMIEILKDNKVFVIEFEFCKDFHILTNVHYPRNKSDPFFDDPDVHFVFNDGKHLECDQELLIEKLTELL